MHATIKRTYTAPRLIRPEAEELSPEGKASHPVEFTTFGGFANGPS